MKFKKVKQSKSLLIAATLSTIGLTGISGATAFAAEIPSVNLNSDKVDNYSTFHVNLMFYDAFKKFCLDIKNDESISKINNLRTEELQRSVDTTTIENPTDAPMTIKTQEKSYKQTDSVTVTHAKEFSFGQEISAEFGPLKDLLNMAKLNFKATFGQKITDSTANAHSTEEAVKFGGDSITVKPGHKVKVEYVFSETKYSGKLETVSPVKYNVKKAKNISYIYESDVPYYKQKLPYVAKFNGGSNPFSTDYYFFKDAHKLPDKEAILIYYDNEDVDTYFFYADELNRHIILDENKKQAYYKDSSADFEALKGTGLKIKVTDLSNGEILKNEFVSYF